MHKDSDLRDNDANPTCGEASLGALQGPGRRQVLTATALGAVAMATPSLLGRSRAASQTAEEPDRDRELGDRELDGKTAFITGGARGIGFAAAEELAKAGANIVLYDVASRTLPHVQYPIATERDLEPSIQKSIKLLESSGDIAPTGCCIVHYQARGNKKHYWYYKFKKEIQGRFYSSYEL